MNVGDLFINLGIKGSEKTLGALTETKKGLGGLASMSLEAKAGIVAAMYALERLFATSGAAGTGLTNFTALLGVSAKTLQQYQYAARQMGVSNQEVETTFKNLQSTMTKGLLNKGVPEGLARVGIVTGQALSQKDINDYAKNPALLLQKLQEYARKETNAGLRNEVLKSFNIGDGMAAAMSRNAFRSDVFKQAPTYSPGEISALDKANIAWSNLGTKIEMAVGKFNSKHGGMLVTEISKITDSVVHLAEALERVAEKVKLFQTIANGLEGIANSMKLISEIFDKVQGKESKKGDLLYTKPGQEAIPGLKDSPFGKFMQSIFGSGAPEEKAKPYSGPLPADSFIKKSIAPSVPAASSAAGTVQNISVKQDLHFQHDGKDHKKNTDSVTDAHKQAFRQYSQAQGA